ncbi:maltodextrin glucosidase [Actinocorallia libanotica]|uniref:Maltodextrin glucosidase n=2 Tax=Actinocorallia libanotica TaxID=46162 RepID=A0ABP4B0E2_9ACTN
MSAMFDQGFHHDGSLDHVSTLAPEPGETVTVFLRTPRTQRDGVHVRSVRDGEPHFDAAVIDRETEDEIWWRADVTARNPITPYRFLLTGPAGYRWLTAAGLCSHDVPDATDFRLNTYAPPPGWAADATVYEIFPDRFASSSPPGAVPDWAVPTAWDEPVQGRGPLAPRQLFGGDLPGVTERLDHIASLGVDTLWLTPVFPARSNHRYNSSSFDRIDPLLGGDAAYRALIDAAHARGWRVLGDLTTNHCGDDHPWFTAALGDKEAPERGRFRFHDEEPGYETWMGVPSLPKLDWADDGLIHDMIDGPEAIVRRWLRFGLDGWRIDVANMTGRRGAADLTREVAARIRRAVAEERRDGLLVAEHAHDSTRDLDADGWHGTMNYAGFTRPVWSWLRGPQTRLDFLGVPAQVPRLSGTDAVATMRAFSAQTSWRSFTHSWSILSSHDTARIRTVCGDGSLTEVAVGLLFTLPGTPMVYAGDEFGLEGSWGEDARRPMPWSRPDTWDTRTLDVHRTLGALRKKEKALRQGGLRWLHVSEDGIVFTRERAGDRLLVMAARAAHTPVRIRLGTEAQPVYGGAHPLLPASDGLTTLPCDGPAFHIWRY